jgi:hypothetical protein
MRQAVIQQWPVDPVQLHVQVLERGSGVCRRGAIAPPVAGGKRTEHGRREVRREQPNRALAAGNRVALRIAKLTRRSDSVADRVQEHFRCQRPPQGVRVEAVVALRSLGRQAAPLVGG